MEEERDTHVVVVVVDACEEMEDAAVFASEGSS